MSVRINLPDPDEFGSTAGVEHLTPRELSVLQLIASGYSNREICDELYLSINSVKTYVRSAYRRIGIESRAQAILWGIRNGLGRPRRPVRHPATAVGLGRMIIEFSLSDAQALRRAMLLLNDLGHRAEAGSARMGNPFPVRVRGVDAGDLSAVRALIASVDPGCSPGGVSEVNAAALAPRAA